MRGLLGAASLADAVYEITCQNCGGTTTFTGTLTATKCPFCATPIQRTDIHDAPDRLKVDGVLPFAVSGELAHAQVDAWIDSRWFAPTEFKKYREVGALSSVYMSYFSYTTDAVSDYVGERGRRYTVTVGSGENERTETRIDWTPVRGRVHSAFRDVPALANSNLDGGRVEALKPWPLEQTRPFTTEYLAGHLSNTYDRGPEETFALARREEIDPTIDARVRRDIGGDEQRVHRVDSIFDPLDFRYLLIPLWLLTVVYAGKPFQVYINGVTGEVQGQRPYSVVKIVAAVIGVLAAIAAAWLLVRMVGG
ncbi:MAG: hypothetical protein QM809_17480 [Gordonia sp. (in: high G+C Gram-positive bacteria)]|uniref:hypothetical protein n=1 Tax=Gordonia sp. (in: high G+C Gram-positive bacteria) TaxID=84139 RepID=UPI0039E66D88